MHVKLHVSVLGGHVVTLYMCKRSIYNVAHNSRKQNKPTTTPQHKTSSVLSNLPDNYQHRSPKQSEQKYY